jgi:hypothetical protein
MTPNNNNIPFFFSVKHIIKPHTSKLIYGIRYNETDYFIQKTHGVNDCERLDDNLGLDAKALKKICDVISEIEKEYKKKPPLEFINMDIFKILSGRHIRNNTDQGG